MSSLSTTNTTNFSDRYGRLLPGLLLSGVIAWGAIQLGKLESVSYTHLTLPTILLV